MTESLILNKNEYEPTEADEEVFFMIYHMGVQPSEAYQLPTPQRQWFIQRFVHQKKAEEEAFLKQQLAQQVARDLRVR